jgi:hypothetical protein
MNYDHIQILLSPKESINFNSHRSLGKFRVACSTAAGLQNHLVRVKNVGPKSADSSHELINQLSLRVSQKLLKISSLPQSRTCTHKDWKPSF